MHGAAADQHISLLHSGAAMLWFITSTSAAPKVVHHMCKEPVI